MARRATAHKREPLPQPREQWIIGLLPSDYWKVPSWVHGPREREAVKAALRKKGVSVDSRYSTLRLNQVHHRVLLGLLVYDKCTKQELLQFVKSRNLSPALQQPLHTMLKGQIVEMLEVADNSVVFANFLDFPPEIREVIFKFHLKSLHYMGFPSQPPVAKVSRIFRSETLPLFYQCFQFTVPILHESIRSPEKNDGIGAKILHGHSMRLHNLKVATMRQIRYLRVYGTLPEVFDSTHDEGLADAAVWTYYLDFDKGEITRRFEHSYLQNSEYESTRIEANERYDFMWEHMMSQHDEAPCWLSFRLERMLWGMSGPNGLYGLAGSRADDSDEE